MKYSKNEREICTCRMSGIVRDREDPDCFTIERMAFENFQTTARERIPKDSQVVLALLPLPMLRFLSGQSIH